MVKRGDSVSRILKMAGLTLVDAMIYNEALARIHGDIPSLSRVRAKKPLKRSMENSWNLILKKDYEPIFVIALELIRAFPSSPALESALEVLVDEAEKIASSKALLRHDLMGRIYHRLLLAEIAKYYATYYTSIPAAYILARLALETKNPSWKIDWSKADEISNLRVGDLACGSGTLLSAACACMLDKYVLACASKEIEPDLNILHKTLLEKILWGLDVLSYAAHLTVTTLALHNPEAFFEEANIYALPLGVFGKEKRMGSIDLLNPKLKEIDAATTFTHGAVGPERRGVEKVEKTRVVVPEFQLVIMNPPFTRSVGGNLLFGDLPANQRKILQKELRKLLKERGFSGIGQAGLGAVFIVLADEYLEAGGRLALVAPRSLLSGVSWRKIRHLLSDKYQIEYVITSHQAPNDWNFSENTNLSEILLVARKKPEKCSSQSAVVINLWKKPLNEMESIILSKLCINLRKTFNLEIYNLLENPNASYYELRVGGKKTGEAFLASQELMKASSFTWGALAPFAQSDLNRVSFNFINSGIISIPSSSTSEIIPIINLGAVLESFGPDVRQVHDAFSKTSSYTAYNALWYHDSNYVKTIELDSNFHLKPKPEKREAASRLCNSGSGRLLIAERLWLNTHRLFTVYLPVKALSNMWWPIRLREVKTLDNETVSGEDHEKIQAVWLNSVLGLLGALSYRQDTRGPWVKFKKDALRMIPVLDVSKLTKKQGGELLKLYEDVSNQGFYPLPKQFEEAILENGVRYELDMRLLETVTGKKLDLKPLYEYLAREPIITVKPLA